MADVTELSADDREIVEAIKPFVCNEAEKWAHAARKANDYLDSNGPDDTQNELAEKANQAFYELEKSVSNHLYDGYQILVDPPPYPANMEITRDKIRLYRKQPNRLKTHFKKA